MFATVHHALPPLPGAEPAPIRLSGSHGYVVDARDWAAVVTGTLTQGTDGSVTGASGPGDPAGGPDDPAGDPADAPASGCTVCGLAHELVDVLDRLSHSRDRFAVIAPWWMHIGRLQSTLRSHLPELELTAPVLYGDLDSVEDLLWSTQTLDEDADCAATAHAELTAVAVETAGVLTERATAGDRAIELLTHLGAPALGPSAEFVAGAAPMRIGLTGESEHFVTEIVSAAGPLDTERFCRALPEAAAGACRIRGTVWVDSRPETRVRLCGIGARVWMEEDGAWFAPTFSSPTAVLDCHPHCDAQLLDTLCHWHPQHGDRYSRIALTAPKEYAQDWSSVLAGAVRSTAGLPAAGQQ